MKNDFETIMGYCRALEANNNRTWFHENHKWYEQATADYKALLEKLRFTIGENAPGIASDVLYTQVKDWMYRIPRDMRMKRDVPPYNPAYRAYISADRKSWLPIGYFLRIAPGSSCFGTGVWCWDTAHTNIIRDYLCDHAEEARALLREAGLQFEGESLKKMPHGYENCTDAADLIKLKNWSVIVTIPDEKLTDFKSFAKMIKGYVNRMEPIREFLLTAANSRKTRKQELEDFYQS